ncbi:oligosaccharide flippase family protein [Flammeovirga yaeyamensis]|uniref:Oligosaccharide flippase family protein n=1 Tax=Flammeovirga yaeyamensis TaxID=367791 RepID=A0AAX1MXY1_9BACT|nr:oligosaccharide flippase family protein [Flammeovirga yaeyamensis]MBB3696328.1 O-antigen/teichoic acid export membrane protein [Flammeovirga yaeyamensis]NMF35007.1 oligosaccharide flippase family protein [Flammeovirga yaeyamensis]QWG00166.1 oligosaccharide flippase family protein [Flammeovirga yaeyamensis]
MSFLKNLTYEFSSKVLSQAVVLLGSVFMTRFLTPADYASFGIMVVIVVTLNVFQDFSLHEALIQKNQVSDRELSTAFWVILTLGFICFLTFNLSYYGLTFVFDDFTYQPLAAFILSLCFLFEGWGGLSMTKLKIDLKFKITSIVYTISSLSSTILGLIIAYQGYGIFALVWTFLLRYALQFTLFYFLCSWKPKVERTSLASFYPYMKTRSASVFLNNLFSQIDILLIQFVGSSLMLGSYVKAKSIQQQISNSLFQVVNNLLLPYFSKGNKTQSSKILFNRSILVTFLITFSIALFLFFTSEHLFVFFFGEVWRTSGQYFGLLSFLICTQSVYQIAEVYYNSLGETKFTLRVNMLGKGLFLGCLFVLYFFGILPFIISMILVNMLAILILKIKL